MENIKERYAGKKIVFTCGVHRLYKGLIYLVQAAQYLPNDYVVLLAGTGPLTESLIKESKSLGVENVKFLGRISDEEKVMCLKCAEVFAFPSITKNEAFGIALCEALYCGVPAVTFTIPGSGVNYVNQDGITGIEVKEHDPKKFAEALMNCTREKYGAAAHQWAVEHFTEHAIAESVREFFQEKKLSDAVFFQMIKQIEFLSNAQKKELYKNIKKSLKN